MNVDALIAGAGLPTTLPVVFAAHGLSGKLIGAAGQWGNDRPVASTDLFYTASLTKQVTGATMAMLVQSGKIDPDAPIARSFLPKWHSLPTPRQLLHHIGSLPGAGVLEEALNGRPWTNEYVLEAAANLDPPEKPVGSTYVYSNAGYVILAAAMEGVAGRSFPELAAQVLPASSTTEMAFPAGKTPSLSPQVSRHGPSQRLSRGDGGLWSTAAAYADFLDLQNQDAFGRASLMQSDMVLPSGEPTHYGWGIGLRQFRGHPLFIHGGSWTGVRCKAVRCPALHMSVVVLTAGGEEKAVGALVDALCSLVTPG